MFLLLYWLSLIKKVFIKLLKSNIEYCFFAKIKIDYFSIINREIKYKIIKGFKFYFEDHELLNNAHGYIYPHDFGGYVKQKYLAKPMEFMEFKSIGYETKMKEWIRKLYNFS